MVAESRAVSQAWSSASISMTPHLLRASPRWAAGRLDVDSDCSLLSRLRESTMNQTRLLVASLPQRPAGIALEDNSPPSKRHPMVSILATSDEARSDRGSTADGLYEKSDVEVQMRHRVSVGVLRNGSGSIPSRSGVMCARVREPPGPRFVPGPGASRPPGNRRPRSSLQRSAVPAARCERRFPPSRALAFAAELRQATESPTVRLLDSSSSAGAGPSRHRGPAADLLVAPFRSSGAVLVNAGAHEHAASDVRPQ